MKKGDKLWIRHGNTLREAEIINMPADGRLVEFRMSFDSGKISGLAKLFGHYFTDVEEIEQFKTRLV